MVLPVNARPQVVPLDYEGVEVETLLAVYKEAHLLAGFEFSGQVVDKEAAKNGAHVVRLFLTFHSSRFKSGCGDRMTCLPPMTFTRQKRSGPSREKSS